MCLVSFVLIINARCRRKPEDCQKKAQGNISSDFYILIHKFNNKSTIYLKIQINPRSKNVWNREHKNWISIQSAIAT